MRGSGFCSSFASTDEVVARKTKRKREREREREKGIERERWRGKINTQVPQRLVNETPTPTRACGSQKKRKKKTICSAARLTVDNELTLQDKVSESIETVDLSFSPSHRSGAAV